MQHQDLTFIKPLVAQILLDDLDRREWTVQGFGFLRTYFGPPDAPKRFRLNLWDTRFTVPGVSTIHDHPWDFKSLIVAGVFGNQRYNKRRSVGGLDEHPSHHFATIKTGVGGGMSRSDVQSCVLEKLPVEHYVAGDTYHQRADEIHETYFADGAVTLNERVGDTQQARVFWPHGTEWVDALPRVAHQVDVREAVRHTLERWF